MHVKGNFWGGVTGADGPITSSLVTLDPGSGELKKRVELPYPNYAGALTTAGGIVVTALIDGTILAFDDESLEELWRINVGTGFNAPPMTYSVGGKQYIAIASGLCCAGAAPGQYRNARVRISRTPELRQIGNATMVFVFGL
jgi:alcohol dehydrogenase (cytochrome c)